MELPAHPMQCVCLVLAVVLVACFRPALSDYVAAVVEYRAISWLLPAINRDQAKAIIGLNIDAFDYYTSSAVAKGADIIVFPEYGVTGFVHEERDYIVPFLESVPNPREMNSIYIPCHKAQSDTNIIQHRLSCLALKYNVTVVANLMTAYRCSHKADPHCPDDGRYQYNTDIAFTPNGQLVARYHKENLYTGEALIFNPGVNQTEEAAFRTSFGHFGLFTCFDLLFAEPANRLINRLGVDTMVFPTAWMNELPLLSGVEYQQAWSLSYGVNVLASNQHYPSAQMTGSGIYSPTGAVSYTYDMESVNGRMILAKVPSISVVPRERVDIEVAEVPERKKVKFTKDEAENYGGISSSLLSGYHGENLNQIHSGREESADAPKYFTALLNHDPYYLTLLEGKEGHVSITSNDVTCALDFVRESDSELYALGVFDGLHTMNGNYYVQCCSFIRCGSDTDPYRCGAEVSEASTVFQSFSLTIRGQSNQTRLFPEVVTSGVSLPPLNTEWEFSPGADRVWSEGGVLKKPLVAANIFGRWYQRD